MSKAAAAMFCAQQRYFVKLVNVSASSLTKVKTDPSVDVAALVELIARHHRAQVMLIMGKTALTRGLSTEQYAFPEIGVPAYNALTGATLRQPMQPG
jgi:hypothetical protein